MTEQGGSAGGGAPGLDDAGPADASTPDDGRAPDGGANPSCEALVRVADGRAEVAQLVSSFGGATVPTVQEAGDEAVILMDLAIPLTAPTGEATVAALMQLPTSPFRGLALTGVVKTVGMDDMRVASVLRTAPQPNVPWFARPALTATLTLRAGQWRIIAATINRSVIFARPEHVAQLAACSPSDTAPPTGAFTFEGMNFVNNCMPSGTYRYTSRPTDEVRWASGFGQANRPAWHFLAGTWRVLRPAHLTVNPTNYWPRVEESDARCGAVVGWELMIDVVTGELVESKPGLNCTTC